MELIVVEKPCSGVSGLVLLSKKMQDVSFVPLSRADCGELLAPWVYSYTHATG